MFFKKVCCVCKKNKQCINIKSKYFCLGCYNRNSYKSEYIGGNSSILTCGICNEHFNAYDYVVWEYGAKYYANFSTVNNTPICEKCYENAPRSAICRVCQDSFVSRNELLDI